MRNFIAGMAVLIVACVTGCFGIPSAVADDPQVPGPPIPGIAPNGTVKAAPQVPGHLCARIHLTKVDCADMITHRRAGKQSVREAGRALVVDDLLHNRGPNRLQAPDCTDTVWWRGSLLV